MLRQLFAHTSNYIVGRGLVMLAGLISFPIFTRIFGVEEYGILGLISTTLVLVTGLAKLGVQHSIVRFYGEVRAGKHRIKLRHYHSTVVFGMAGAGAIVALTWAVAAQAVPVGWWNDARVPGLLLLTSVLVFVRALDSSLANILRAEERSGAYSTYDVLKRYATLLVVLMMLWFVMRDLHGFYLGLITTEGVAVALLAATMMRARSVGPRAFSAATFHTMLAFGVPMMAYELSGVVLSMGDRYVIQAYLGSGALGLYAAGYSLCEYVQGVLVVSVEQAIMPMYVRSFEEHGELVTRRFIERVLRLYLMVGMAVIAGLSAVAPELLVLLASEKYRGSAQVVPYIIAGMVCEGMMLVVGAGLFIHKKTPAIAGLVAAAALLNMGLNLVLVPASGVVGAALATLVSGALLLAGTLAVSARIMPVSLPWVAAAKFAVLASVMYLLVGRLHAAHELVGLATKVGVGAVMYMALVIACDAPMRSMTWRVLRGWYVRG